MDLCFQSFQEELELLPGQYAPPQGALLLGHDGEAPVGCGGLRGLSPETCELKRIYVRPWMRGQGLGAFICGELMQRGRDLGYTKVRLDTLRRLEAAGKMYERMGFREIEPYNFNPEPDIVYLERWL